MSTTTVSTHPLASVTTDEIAAVRQILAEAGELTETCRFAYVGLEEPARSVGTEPAGTTEQPGDRCFRVLLHDTAGTPPRDIVVSVTRGTVDLVRIPRQRRGAATGVGRGGRGGRGHLGHRSAVAGRAGRSRSRRGPGPGGGTASATNGHHPS